MFIAQIYIITKALVYFLSQKITNKSFMRIISNYTKISVTKIKYLRNFQNI